MAKPEIRLKGFEGEWKECPLGDISTSFSGGTPSAGVAKYYGGNIPFIRSGEITGDKTQLFITEEGLDASSARIVEKGTLLYALYGATSGEVSISKIDGAINQAILAIYPKKGYSTKYLSHYLRSKKDNIVSTLLQGGQGNLSGALVKSINVNLPETSEEQDAIANYLDSMDTLIQSTTKKIVSLKQVKQASLVSMFPQAGETIPRVRFKGFEGEWVVKKLSSIANRVTRKNTHLESTLPLTISAAEGLIEQTSFFNNVVASSNVSGYYLVKKGEFAYNKSYSNGYPFGAVKRLDRFEKGVLSTLYIVFSIDEKVSSDYIVQFFETSLWHQEVAKRAAEGARNHGLLNIGADDFLDINIYLPNSKDEQQRIASFFRSLDKQISLQEKRLEKLKQIKAACLDKMFV